MSPFRYAGILAAAVLGAALAGCATPNREPSTEPDEPLGYVTGSRLPAKNGGYSTKTTSDRSEINSMMNTIPSVGKGAN